MTEDKNSVVWAESPREPPCICDAFGACPQGCSECSACSEED